MRKNKYYIIDWAGNILGISAFDHYEFNSENDAIEFIESEMPEDLDDVRIIDKADLKDLKKRTKLA